MKNVVLQCFKAAQREINSTEKGEAASCFQQKCLFILQWKSIRRRQQNRSEGDKSRGKTLLTWLSSASKGNTSLLHTSLVPL